jgi:GT2 family glycosyltransferase
MADVAVVIPTKDRVQYLRKTVPMFLAQDEVKEVIIVVDGCSDNTLEYVKDVSARDKRIRFTDNVVNRGLPYSRNRGIELVECDFVFTGEDDLEVTDNFFGTLLAHMDETGADIISGRNIFRGQRETAADAIARTEKIKSPAVNRQTLMLRPDLITSGDQEQPLLPAPMLGRVDVFRKIRFDGQYRGNAWREESDFQLSAWEAGYKLVYCPHAISFNVQIENDRGGVHATWGFKRVAWVVRNNWRFVRKHSKVIMREFDIKNPYLYILKFAILRVFGEVVLPKLVTLKSRLFATSKPLDSYVRKGARLIPNEPWMPAYCSWLHVLFRASTISSVSSSVGSARVSRL